MNYFIITNNVQQGPFSLDELRQRGIQSDTLVWHEGMADWQPAWQVPELHELLYGQATPPPTPGVQGQPQGTQVPPVNGQQQPSPTGVPPVEGFGDRTQTAGVPPTQTPGQQPGQQQATSRRWRNICLAVLALLLILAAVTNPSADDHRRVIKEHLQSAVTKAFGLDSNDILSQGMGMITQAITGPIVSEVVDSMTDYHNYIFWSTTTIHYEDEDHSTSFGIFGHVMTMDEERLAEHISKSLNGKVQSATSLFRQMGPGSQAAPDQSDDTDDTQATDDAESSIEKEVNQTVRDAAKRMGDDIVDQLSKTAKDQLKQNTDSTTSTGLGKIIDEITKLFKN